MAKKPEMQSADANNLTKETVATRNFKFYYYFPLSEVAPGLLVIQIQIQIRAVWYVQ